MSNHTTGLRARLVLCAATALFSAAALAHGEAGHGAEAGTPAPHAPGAAAGGPAYDGHAAALGAPGDPARATRTVRVLMRDNMRFSPAAIRVRRGETVRLEVVNQGKVKHELVLGTSEELKAHAAQMQKHPEMEHDDPNAVSVAPGQRAQLVWTFSKSGRFDFACLVPGHYEAGMQGSVTVDAR